MRFFTFNTSSANKNLITACKFSVLLFLAIQSRTFAVAQSNNGTSILSIQLLLNNNGGSSDLADAVLATYNNNFSKAIGNEDSYKFSNLDENVSINRNGINLSIEGRPIITSADTIPLNMWQFRQNTYILKFDAQNFTSGLHAVVRDSYLKRDFPFSLSAVTLIPFSITTDPNSFALTRFTVLFEAKTSPVTLTDINALYKDNGVQLTWIAGSQETTDRLEIEKSVNAGPYEKAADIKVTLNNGNAQNYSWYDSNVSSGDISYRIKAIDRSGMVKYSEPTKVIAVKAKPSLTIYPNPVTGNTFKVRFSNMVKGRYTVSLYNNNSQKVYTGMFEYNGISETRLITIDKKIRAGIYRLQLYNGITTINRIIIFQ